MIFSYLKQINWIDVLVIIILIRMCYIAVKTGFSIEIFKLLGTVCAIYLACHYYIRASGFLNSTLSLQEGAGLRFLQFFVFLLLAFLGYLFFVIVRVVISTLIRMEANSLLNHWGAFSISVIRLCLFISLLFFSIAISNLSYLKRSLSNSFSGPRLINLTPKVYASVWSGLVSRFMNKESFNQSASQVKLAVSE